MKKFLLFIGIFCIQCKFVSAQYTTDKVVGQKNQALADSLKKADYPYLLPIWGKKVVNKGFNLPYSAGLSVQYIWQQSDIIINNLSVGFNNGPMHDLDEIIRFDKAQTNTNGVNFRPDIWVFPFLNVYGILAKSKTTTAVDCGLWIPDDSSWKQVTDFNAKADFEATSFGIGLTPTVGISGFFLAMDVNFTWNDIPELDKPAFAFVFGPRLGKNLQFKKPNRSLAIWAGGFRIKLNTGTTGSLNIGDLFPLEQWEQKIETGYSKVGESQEKVDDWWNSLSSSEQKNPVNIAKHESANAALGKAGNILNAASQAVANVGSSTVQYSLDKKPKNMWNFIVGSQFQLNKNWMIRAEYGFLGSRNQFIGGLQYRFGL